jgi:CRP-like cAMP-binding protein
MITTGEVEVLRPGDGGGADEVLDRLGPRYVFGERALLEDTKRTASVRSVGQVDVLVMSRGDFRSLVSQFPVLQDYFERLLTERNPGMLAGKRLMDCVSGENARERAPAPPPP